MRLYDYKLSTESDKREWLETFKITSGLSYFGGKQFIGKYLMNRLLNMAVRMMDDGKKADIFIDAFTGGGKMGLSVPEGWFDMIVINDLDYGVVSYFRYCKEHPEKLIKMIEKLGKHMSKDLFKFFAYNRCNSSEEAIKKMKKEVKKEYSDLISDKVVDPLLAGAMTYWVVQADFNGCTDPGSVSYCFDIQDNKEKNGKKTHEKERIGNAIALAKKRIPEIHRIMNSRNVVIESLDYRELIKKYNGKPYKNKEGKKTEDNKEFGKKNKLWYFDPPYHPATLFGGKEAPYMNSFPVEMVSEMTEILHNDRKEVFGELEYFIKSDYNPKYTYEQFFDSYKEEKSKGESTERLQTLKKQAVESKKAYHDFDVLEENDEHSKENKTCQNEEVKVIYYVECIGDFGKGANDGTGEKETGREYIWCRGNYQGEESSDWKYDGTETLP